MVRSAACGPMSLFRPARISHKPRGERAKTECGGSVERVKPGGHPAKSRDESRPLICPYSSLQQMPCEKCGLVIILLLFLSLGLVPALGSVGERKAEMAEKAMVGRWEASVGRFTLSLRFLPNHQYVLGEERGTYSVDGSQLRLARSESEGVGYAFDLEETFLVLRGGDLEQEVRFVRTAADEEALRGYFSWMLDFSLGSLEERSYRILTIVGIVVVSVLFVNLLRLVSSILIFSDSGPFRYIYRRHKTKTRTVHSVVLNFVKYIIYFTALGHVLAELGINYATYFASLSVVGLAIGFGSQGLVQDIVTGFFLIFDGQFGVGDMVEISGQTGVVEELGLRTTRVRTYMGQTVVIPNRNIALVANYSKGAVRAYVDVGMADAATAATAAGKVTALLGAISRQFEGTVLKPPQDLGLLQLQSGEVFQRWSLEIWPQQHQALIDQQVLPRIRELMAREEIQIPGDRIAVSFHLPEKRPLPVWRGRFGRKAEGEGGGKE